MVTPYLRPQGQVNRKGICWSAGLGGRKKRRPLRNGADTGFNVTRHESEPTSDGCLSGRKYGEHLKREKQKETEVVRPPVGAAPPLASPEPGVYRVSIAEVARLYG